MAENTPAKPSTGLSRWWGGDPMRSLRDEMNDMLSRFSTDWEGGGWLSGDRAPALDLSESDAAFEIRMDVPGVKPEDIDVQVSGNSVRITGKSEERHEEKDKTYHRVERRSGSFTRVVPLPTAVSAERVAAECRDGVLTVTLPKTEEHKSRKVEVRS